MSGKRRALSTILAVVATLAIVATAIYLFLPKGPRAMMAFDDPWNVDRSAVPAKDYAVTAGTPQAADVGMAVMAKGGNAFDAAAAGLLALNATHDEAASFPGIAPLVIYDAKTREVASYVGAGVAPAAATLERFKARGYKTVPDLNIWAQLVPASPDVVISLLKDHGTISFSEAAAPAIRLAREGVPVHHVMLHNMGLSLVSRLAYAVLFPYNAKVYFGGQWWRPLHAKERLAMPDLAATLEGMAKAEATATAAGKDRIAGLEAARDYFYKGPVAVAIARLHKDKGGLMTAQDLASYAGHWEEPVVGSYGAYTFYTNGTWSQGAVGPLALQILEGIDLKALGHNSPAYVHTLAQAIELAMADREAFMGDPAFVKVPLAQIMGKAYAAGRREMMTDRAFAAFPQPGRPSGTSIKAGPSGPETSSLGIAALLGKERYGKDTSHIAVIDRWGNAVSMTPSDFPKSPMVPGTGLTLGNRMTQFRLDPASPNVLAPGKRPRVTPHAVIVFKDGAFFMAFGTPGDDMQTQALVQVFLNMAVFDMDLEAAIKAPRFRSMSVPASFAPHRSLPATLLLEAGLNATAGPGLEARGYKVTPLPDWDNTCGAVGAILRTSSGSLLAGSDPREEGWAEGK